MGEKLYLLLQQTILALKRSLQKSEANLDGGGDEDEENDEDIDVNENFENENADIDYQSQIIESNGKLFKCLNFVSYFL